VTGLRCIDTALQSLTVPAVQTMRLMCGSMTCSDRRLHVAFEQKVHIAAQHSPE